MKTITGNRRVRAGGFVRIVGIATAMLAALGISSAMTGQAQADTYSKSTTLCTASVGSPYVPIDRRGGVLAVNQTFRILPGAPYREAAVRGRVDLRFVDSPIIFGPAYDQTAVFFWHNLSTGRTGRYTAHERVIGEMPNLGPAGLYTGPGRVRFSVQITNTGLGNLGSSALVQRGGCSGGIFVVR